MIATDSNVLARLLIDVSPAGDALRDAVRRAIGSGDQLCLPAPCIGEFWRVVTWDKNPERVSPAVAYAFLSDWISRNALLLPGPRYWSTLAALIAAQTPSTLGIFDYQIAAVRIEHAVDAIWTFDSRFPRSPRLSLVDPLAL